MGVAPGGHGGIVFNADGTMTKPTNQTEVDFLTALHHPAGGIQGNPYAVIAQYQQLGQHIPAYYGAGIVNGDTIIKIRNISHNVPAPRLMDIKIGAGTVSKKELRHAGVGAVAAFIKKRKMDLADWHLGSSERGFRVIHYTGGPENRREVARQAPAIALNALLPPGPTRVQALHALQALGQAVENTQGVFFIAASVLFCVGGGNVALKLIDFGHSHIAGAGNTNAVKYRNQFLLGLQSLRNHLA